MRSRMNERYRPPPVSGHYDDLPDLAAELRGHMPEGSFVLGFHSECPIPREALATFVAWLRQTLKVPVAFCQLSVGIERADVWLIDPYAETYRVVGDLVLMYCTQAEANA